MTDNADLTFVLLRGLTRESAHWGDFVSCLEDSFPSATLCLLDLPGTGVYFQEQSPSSVREIVERVRREAINQHCLNSPVILLGVSLGAMVAWEWQMRYPEKVAGSVLINVSFGGLSPFYQRLRWQCYPELIAALCKRTISARERALLPLLCNSTDLHDRVGNEWVKIQKLRPVSSRNALRQLLAAVGYKPYHERPQGPILMLNSAKDRLVSPVCSETIQQKWGLELQTHPTGGHDLTLDDGEWVAKAISRWWGQVQEASRVG